MLESACICSILAPHKSSVWHQCFPDMLCSLALNTWFVHAQPMTSRCRRYVQYQMLMNMTGPLLAQVMDDTQSVALILTQVSECILAVGPPMLKLALQRLLAALA